MRLKEEDDIILLHVNIRGWTTHNAELAARIRLMERRPTIVCLNETHLSKIEGYEVVHPPRQAQW